MTPRFCSLMRTAFSCMNSGILPHPAQPANGSGHWCYEFHWSVPPSNNAKRWYMVLDNQAHDGDAGQGDQGGITSVVSAEVALLTQAYWTPFNDLVAVDSDDHTVLLSGEDLRLDAGTTVVLSAWDLEFVGDVYLQARAMYDRYVANGVGVQYIDGGALQSVSSPQSLTWWCRRPWRERNCCSSSTTPTRHLGAETAPKCCG